MPDTMKAVVYYAPGDIRFEQIDVPVCGEGEIRVKIDACAVCGTDLKAYVSGNPRIRAPKVMGHEFTGIVDAIGNDALGFEIGDRIVMATSVSCGDCYYCKQGHSNLCVNIAPMGFTFEGGMAEYTVIPARGLEGGHAVKVPPSVPAEHAALAEPLSCAVNSCFNCDIQQGDTVVIIGTGPMGIMNACVAQQFGASKIILAEINKERLKQAEPFGFDLRVNPAKKDLAEIVMQQTGGLGADVVIVAAPAAKPQEDALSLVRKRGTVCLFASLPAGKSEITIDSRIVHYGEIKLVGSSDSTPEQVRKAVEMISSGCLKADNLASHVLPLDDVMKSFKLMESGKALRVVLKP